MTRLHAVDRGPRTREALPPRGRSGPSQEEELCRGSAPSGSPASRFVAVSQGLEAAP